MRGRSRQHQTLSSPDADSPTPKTHTREEKVIQRSDRKEMVTECTQPEGKGRRRRGARATEAQSRSSGVVLDALQLIQRQDFDRALATGPITRISALGSGREWCFDRGLSSLDLRLVKILSPVRNIVLNLGLVGCYHRGLTLYAVETEGLSR